MKIRDIVNRDIINIQNCESEPIHIPGSIQPHGFLIGVRNKDFTITFCSGNSVKYIGLTYQQLLGKSFSQVFNNDQVKQLEKYITLSYESSAAPLEIKLNNNMFTCTVKKGGTVDLWEFEPRAEKSIAITDLYRQTKQFTFYMEKAVSLQTLCQSVAEETRSITGYDRVMIYRFDECFNGEIFAESRIENIEPYWGLHYPHTDIPAQARELYIRNLLRLIVNVHYKPVPIYVLDDEEDKNLDLSLSTLRSVSPIHIQYLQNMGVAATLTISLIHEGRLWGLIACHHYSPKFIGSDTRLAAQLQGHFLTSQIRFRELAEEYVIAKKVNKSLDDLISQVFSVHGITLDKMIMRPELLGLTNASGVIISVDGNSYSHGNVPPADEIAGLISWLNARNALTGFTTDNLSKLYSHAKLWLGTVAGIIHHSLGSGPDDCIIWCKPEYIKEVHWAGNPSKAVIVDKNGLSPRKSFELWKEFKKDESTPWQTPELLAAANFANAFQKNVYLIFLAKEELKHRELNEKLKEANDELENITWIGSHDLKEPLRKIQMFVSRIIEQGNLDNIELVLDSAHKVNKSAKIMQLLIKDMLSYSRLGHEEDSFEEINLNYLINVILLELNTEIKEIKAAIIFENLPFVKGIPVLLKQLLINLIRNALKFSKKGVPPLITIISATENDFLPWGAVSPKDYHKIIFRDNGIGFDNKYKDIIFKVFTKLDNYDETGGSGVGLALCKKIMRNHKGMITANGEPGVGAAFTLYFPK